MSMNRVRTARELVLSAGKVPAIAAAVCLLAPAFAARADEGSYGVQVAQADNPRDPMRGGGGGAAVNADSKVKVSDQMTVDLHVKDEDLANVLELLSIQTQKNIIASKNVGGKVTATLYGVTFYQALDSILHVNGYGYLEDGNFIYVYTRQELQEIEKALKKRVAKVIKLNYLNANDAAEFVKDLLSTDGGTIKTNAVTKAGSEKPAFSSDEYALAATLVVYDYEENIEAIEALIKELDTKPAQVLVEATILQATLNEANAWGVDFSIIGDIDFLDFASSGGPLGAAGALIRGGSGSTGVSPADNQATAITTGTGNVSGPGTLKVGIVGGDVAIFLRMLDQITDTSILSNPKILALNRQPARVLVGRRVGYLSTTSSETSTTQTVEFLDTGTQLYFRPFVGKDGDIRMELKPQVSEAEIRDVTDATGAVVTIPDEITQELVTNVNVHDGQTVVLGGLFREATTLTRRQVPFLGDIPIVGAAFRGNDDSTVRSEIIFLITPSIVSEQVLTDAADRAEDDIVRLRAGSRQGLLPWSRERMTSAHNVEAERLLREGNSQRALYHVQRSLALNPLQPDVYALREKIINEREIWPMNSLLNETIHGEAQKRIQSIPDAPAPEYYHTPDKHHNLPRREMNSDAFSQNIYSGPYTTFASANGSTAATPYQTTASAPFTDEYAFFSPTGTSSTGQMQTFPATPTTGEQAAATTTQQQQTGPQTEAQLQQDSVAAVKRVLPALRGQIDLYSVMNDGALPDLGHGSGSSGWQSLVDSQMIRTAPVNPWIGGPNASKVVIGAAPDTKFHTNYGWIYNPQTGQLWAAGFDAKEAPLDRFAAAQPTTNTSVATTTTPATKSDTVVEPMKEVPAQPTLSGVETDGE